MKRYVLTLVAALVLGLSMLGSVSAASDHATNPGNPGQANCEGLSRAFTAQASKEALGEPGLGNFARHENLSVKEVHALLDTFCNT